MQNTVVLEALARLLFVLVCVSLAVSFFSASLAMKRPLGLFFFSAVLTVRAKFLACGGFLFFFFSATFSVSFCVCFSFFISFCAPVFLAHSIAFLFFFSLHPLFDSLSLLGHLSFLSFQRLRLQSSYAFFVLFFVPRPVNSLQS